MFPIASKLKGSLLCYLQVKIEIMGHQIIGKLP